MPCPFSRYPLICIIFHGQADERDADILLAAVKKLLLVYERFPYRGVDLVGLHDMDDGQLRSFIKATVDNSRHITGTCRMGDVVDSKLRVKGDLLIRKKGVLFHAHAPALTPPRPVERASG